MVQHGEVIETVDAPELHVLDQTAGDGAFTPSLPEGAVSIGCGRSSIIPSPHDDEVLVFGLPFYIIDTSGDRRVGVLEISQGQYRYRMLEGEFSDAEESLVQARLNEFQDRLQSSAD
jgi:hypothetical protein